MKRYPDFRSGHDQSILTAEEVKYVETKVIESVHAQLVARKLFPTRNINDAGARFYIYYDEDDPSVAVLTMDGKAQNDDYPLKTEHEVKLPVIHKTFLLQWRDIASSRRVGASLLDDSIRTATRRVAETEDRLLLSGECPTWSAYGIEGLMTATGRSAGASAGNWPANAIADVNVGRAALQASGYVGREPILIAPPALVKCLDGAIANTEITYRTFLLKNNLVSAIMESTNVYAADCGQDSVGLVVPGEGNFYTVQGLAPTTNLWEDKMGNVHGVVREIIAPVIGRASSIYEITDVVCA